MMYIFPEWNPRTTIAKKSAFLLSLDAGSIEITVHIPCGRIVHFFSHARRKLEVSSLTIRHSFSRIQMESWFREAYAVFSSSRVRVGNRSSQREAPCESKQPYTCTFHVGSRRHVS